ncbi:MAG: tetratricopeptide repeat protein [Ignavibacteria bacterium]|nr:tetratricopeptide repeat protein [Ignavibacteria bacterium]
MINLLKKNSLVFLVLIIFSSSLYAQNDKKGIAAVKRGDYKTGIELLKNVVKTDDDYEVNYYYGYALFMMEQYDEAEKYFKIALKDDDEGVDALRGLGDILAAKKDYNGALSYYKKALKIESEDVPTLISQANSYLAQGKIDNAIDILLKADINRPKNMDILVALGNAYYDRETYPLAIDFYKKALAVNSRCAPAHYGIARSYLRQARNTEDENKKQKFYNDALDKFDKAISSDVNFADAYYEKALILYTAGKYESAGETLVKYIELRPTSSRGKYLYGRTLYLDNKIEKAIPIFAGLLDDTLYSSEGNLYLARIYSGMQSRDSASMVDNYLKSVNYYEKVKAADLEYEDFIKIGTMYSDMKNMTDALQYYKKAVEMEPESGDGYYELGKAYFNNENYISAIENFNKAKAKGLKTSILYLYSGLANYYEKEFEEAAIDFQNSVDLTPTTISYLFLAKSYRQLGKNEEAIKEYENALTLEPDNQEAKDAIKVLTSKEEIKQ